MMQVDKPSIKGEADLENSIAITCDIVIIFQVKTNNIEFAANIKLIHNNKNPRV